MQKLCSRIANLLMKHPILWLPYIAADLLAICLWQLRGLAEKYIFHWFTTGHSVLGGDIALPRHDHAALIRASILYFPIAIATVVVIVCLFVASLLVTVDMVDSIENGQRPDGRAIFISLAAHWQKIILFTLRFLITFLLFTAGTVALSYYLFFRMHLQDFHTPFWFDAGMMPVVVGCTVWLAMPAAMRLLRGEAAVIVPAQTRNQGTILAILVTEAGLALGFFLQKLETSMMLNSRSEITLYSAFDTMIANAPDVLLFVALALLMTGISQEDDSETGSKIHALLPLLMPLHFNKSEEPPQIEE
jgi:hypothetical protein